MAKILYIDLICPFGHNNLNKNIINRLLELGFSVDLIFKKGYVEELDLPKDLVKWEIPLSDYKSSSGKFGERYFQYRILKQIKNKFSLKKYDFIFMSCFEEISLFLSGIKGNLILLNHANIAGIDHWLKRFFIKQLAKYGTFIVFHEFIKKRFLELGIKKVVVEPLGLSVPYHKSKADCQKVLQSLDSRFCSPDFQFRIFIPTGSKYGDNFITKLISEKDFLEFLSAQKIVLIIKDKSISNAHSNIITLPEYISEEVYQSIFLESNLLIINYPQSFTYRVSAVLLECFSNHKACLLSDIEGFRAFENHFRYKAFYKTKDELIKRIEYLLENPDLMAEPYSQLDLLKLSYTSLLQS